MASDLNLHYRPRQARSQSGHYLLLRWNDLHIWQQDNEFILTGYRPISGSFRKSFTSLQHVHNEIVNIYFHLFGAVLFAILPIYVYVKVRNYYLVIQIVLCFSFSAFFYIISNHSEKVAAYWNQFDYLGIVILIWGSTVPLVYYGFYCDQNLQKLYWAVVFILSVFRHSTLRLYRTAMYAFLGLSAIVFITHGLIIYGWEVQKHSMSLVYMLITALLNLLGAVVYVARIPERYHQIFHCIVVFDSFIHMSGLLSAFNFIHSQAQLCLKTEARSYN
ncbi:hemolysin-III related-domain-containing protein [Bisporella sp. PMI_857]|nr:hemolysin-III related-domain-containing protein [Bisporella sp. PMI_857]